MFACSSASGGVMFIPEEIDGCENAISYRDLLKDEVANNPDAKPRLFGRKTEEAKLDKKAA